MVPSRFNASILASALSLGLFFATVSASGATESPSPVASETPSASPSATQVTSPLARKVSKYLLGKPFFLQTAFSQDFDQHLYSYKAAESLWVLVNKVRPLTPINYKPKVVRPRFFKPGQSNPSGQKLKPEAAAALAEMDKAMYSEIKQHIYFSSGYRSFATQKIVHAAKVKQLGKKNGENLAAREGFSEHQTGLAADLATVGSKCVIKVCFAKEKGGKWLAANSWRFGFVLRYPNKQTAVTGYQFEPWHFRYVGEVLAAEYHFLGAPTLEQFFNAGDAPKYDGSVTDPDYFY